MSFHSSPASVIAAVDLTLSNAEGSWRDYIAGGENRYASLVNAITSTRAITNVIQNLRSHVDDFDAWWKVEVEVFDNPIAKWFVDVRNRLEKQGTLGGVTNVTVANVDGRQFDELKRAAPRAQSTSSSATVSAGTAELSGSPTDRNRLSISRSRSPRLVHSFWLRMPRAGSA